MNVVNVPVDRPNSYRDQEEEKTDFYGSKD